MSNSDGCVIKFEVSLDRVNVYATPQGEEACRRFCGARAGFVGDYFRAVPACADAPRKQERARFQAHYGQHRYREAAEVLSAFVNRCGRFLSWVEDAEVRNDLAVTYRRLGDTGACIGVLSPLRRSFVEDEKVTGRAFPPAEAEDGERLTQVTRFNWKACGGQVP